MEGMLIPVVNGKITMVPMVWILQLIRQIQIYFTDLLKKEEGCILVILGVTD